MLTRRQFLVLASVVAAPRLAFGQQGPLIEVHYNPG
jgi:hypothetical protein